ncbi:anaerobic benzoate catabolism transcriptional regulator [compost metagenome]
MATKGKQLKNIGLYFGQNLRARRDALGYTREELAERCHLSPQNIAKIENGDRFVTIESLMNLANALGCDSYEFFVPPKKGHVEQESLDKVLLLLKNKNEKEIELAHQILTLVFKGSL